MDMFEQYIMSYPAECGYGEKKELENTYYYAYMILVTKPIAICRYVELTKKEYEQCREKYSQSYETDPISAQQFFIECLYGKKVLYEGKYNNKIMYQMMHELRTYYGETPTGTREKLRETAWEKLCGSMLKSVKIELIVMIGLLAAMVILKLIIRDSSYVDFALLMVFCGCVASGIAIAYLLIQKKRFLNLENIDLYTNELLYNAIWHTPAEVVTRRFIFFRFQLMKIVDLSQVQWIYRKKFYQGTAGSTTAEYHIVMRMKNGKKRTMTWRKDFTESDLYRLVVVHNPSVMIGMSWDNKNKYKAML